MARSPATDATSRTRGARTPPPADLERARKPENAPTELDGWMKDFVRCLVVAEKSYQLYPIKGKVVQQALQSLFKSLVRFHRGAGDSLELQVDQFDLLHEEASVYHEENRGKSIANRMWKDSVRKIRFLDGIASDELSAFLSCFKSREGVDDEDDFTTLFWEKDFTHIEIEITDDIFAEEERMSIPVPRRPAGGLPPERFSLDAEEEEDLRELIQKRRAETPDGGDRSFELTEEELKRIRELTEDEQTYFPLYDFVDILLEFTLQTPDPRGFDHAMKIIRTVIVALVESLDFEHAAGLLERLRSGPRGDLADGHRHQLRDILSSFCDRDTLQVLGTFLKESPELPRNHEVFRFMKAFDADAVPHFCEFLAHPAHLVGMSDVLAQIGAGCGDIFEQYLATSPPPVARAMMGVITRTDGSTGVERIATALRNRDEGVRIQAAKTLLQHGDARAGAIFLQLLRDRSRQLVLLAVRFFTRVSFPPAYPELLLLTRSKAFHELDDTRQEQVFRALLVTDRERALDHIARQVPGWGFMLSSRATRRKTAALRALAECVDDRAVAILTRAAKKGRGAIARAARSILSARARPAESRVETGKEATVATE